MDLGDRVSGFDWRRTGAAAFALVASIVLGMLVFAVIKSSDGRDRAILDERHSYDVTLMTRSIDASIARAEAALGRFVVDEDSKTSGSIYYNEWRLAGAQIAELDRQVRADAVEQQERIDTLQRLYAQRGSEFNQVVRATVSGKGSGGLGYYYQASQSPTGRELHQLLGQIANYEREQLSQRIEDSVSAASEADALTDYLSWLGLFVGLTAIALGYLSFEAIRSQRLARKAADSESERAEALEQAVAQRTAELSEANDALIAEANERMAAEERLRQAQKMEAVGQLTGGIAHDFNNMLAVVVGGLDLAKRRLGGPRRDVEIHLDQAMEGAERAATLTRRLLTFARSEPLLPDRVEPGRLIEGMRDLLDRTIGEQILVRTEIADDAWPIFTDPHQLENALLNLAVNARDAMDSAGTLTIRTTNCTLSDSEVGELAAGDYLALAVEDSGSGMDEATIARAFEPFFTTKEVGKGTGLGLSQIFGFARQSGGDVTIKSRKGFGTTVTLYLPRTDAEAMASEEVLDAQGNAVPPPPGARILLVEDDPRVRVATIGALEDLGFSPTACASGEEALEAFAPGRFDLVITDVVMPGMNGPELVKRLREQDAHVAILFVTGYVGEGEKEDLIGCDLLRKPFTVKGLSAAVGAALAASESPPSSGAAATG